MSAITRKAHHLLSNLFIIIYRPKAFFKILTTLFAGLLIQSCSVNKPLLNPEGKTKINSLRAEAINAYYEGDLKRSEEKLRSALDISFDTKTEADLAAVLKDSGRFIEAADLYERAGKEEPDPLFLLNYGLCCFHSGQYEKAEIAFEKILKTDTTAFFTASLTEGDIQYEPIPFYPHRFIRDKASLSSVNKKSAYIKMLSEYFLACSYFNRTKYQEAEKELLLVIKANRRFAPAHNKLGDSYVFLNLPDKAVASYNEAVRLDSSLYHSYLKIAEITEQQGKFREAFENYKKVSIIEPKNKIVTDKVKALGDKLSEELANDEQKKEAQRKQAKMPEVLPVGKPGKMPVLRVLLTEDVSVLRLKCLDTFGVFANGKKITDIPAGDEVKFEVDNKYFTIKDKNDKIIKEFLSKERSPVSMACSSRKATFTVYDVTLNKGYFWAKNADRSFRGSLEIIPGPALTLINNIYLDEYLYSVVPSEIGALSNKEALMAQAVIARSYVYNKIGKKTHGSADVCSDVHCQAYNGVLTEHKNTTEAVDATTGEILTDSKGTLNTFFFSCCGGRTRNVEDAWGNKVSECLKGVPDYDEEKVNKEFKDFPLSPSELDRWMKMPPSAYCETDDQFRWFKALDEAPEEYKITKRDVNGFVQEVKSGGKTVAGDRIRSSIPGLRSNLFLTEGSFVYGGGWGHGVGMCQEGAVGMANRGFKYKEILAHYYVGSVLKKIY